MIAQHGADLTDLDLDPRWRSESGDGHLIGRIATLGGARLERWPLEDLPRRGGRYTEEVGRPNHIDSVGPGRPAPGGKIVGSTAAPVSIRADIEEQAVRRSGCSGQT